MTPLISICIPAYKNAEFLHILLESISVQAFRDFEVVISDDSSTSEVSELAKKYDKKYSIKYMHNAVALGSPANWNNAIAHAKGEWIKIMHDDDWFAKDDSLGKFAVATKKSNSDFIFSGYANIKNGEIESDHILKGGTQRKIQKDPFYLFVRNFIGNPSTTLIKNNRAAWYDPYLKWVVDFEFYLDCISGRDIYHIPEVLVHVGIHDEQITKAVFRNKAVEIPEHLYMLNKHGTNILDKIIVYDYYWRLWRNLQIRSVEDIEAYKGENQIPIQIEKMISFQKKIPLRLLNIGLFSKCFMSLSYLTNRS